MFGQGDNQMVFLQGKVVKQMQETTAQDYKVQMEALREEQSRYEEQLLLHRRESRRR